MFLLDINGDYPTCKQPSDVALRRQRLCTTAADHALGSSVIPTGEDGFSGIRRHERQFFRGWVSCDVLFPSLVHRKFFFFDKKIFKKLKFFVQII